MDLLFYVYWRANNIGKQKGYFVNNIIATFSGMLFLLTGTVLITFEHFSGLSIRSHMFDLGAENMWERLAVLIYLLPFILFYKLLQYYFFRRERYLKIIAKYNQKYVQVKDYWFVLIFIGLTIFCIASLPLAGILIRNSSS